MLPVNPSSEGNSIPLFELKALQSTASRVKAKNTPKKISTNSDNILRVLRQMVASKRLMIKAVGAKESRRTERKLPKVMVRAISKPVIKEIPNAGSRNWYAR